MNLVFNPFLPSNEYIPDGEPHIFNDRVYLYGSHDKFNGKSFCLLDYVSYSAPIDDLSSWRYEGIIYKRNQDPNGKKGIFHAMYAPDVVQGNDGKYYLYYFIGYYGLISVAKSDTPNGPFSYYGHVKYKDNILLGKKKEPLQFDPGVFKDDDGTIYLFTGFAPINYPKFLLHGHKATSNGAMGFVLEDDMLTIREGPTYIGVPGKKDGQGSGFEGHEFFEASSLRKFNGKYYFIYSSFLGHELCYAVSENPLKGYKYGGTLVSNADIGLYAKDTKDGKNYSGNTHGSLIEINNKFYVFYHRHTNRHAFSRQACAEEIFFKEDKFMQTELTSAGLYPNQTLPGKGRFEARIACQLFNDQKSYFSGVIKMHKGRRPFITQYQNLKNHENYQYIANFTSKSTAIYKYFDLSRSLKIGIEYKGNAEGIINFLTKENVIFASLKINKTKEYKTIITDIKFTLKNKELINVTYLGKGSLDLKSIILD